MYYRHVNDQMCCSFVFIKFFLGNKIQYVHTSEDEDRMDSFSFEVTDGYNSVYRTFRISIADVNNKLPIVTTNKIRCKEGAKKIITPFEIRGDLK